MSEHIECPMCHGEGHVPVTDAKKLDKQIIKVNEDQRLVHGWAYIAQDKQGNVVVDRQGDYIANPSELERAAHKFVKTSRVQGDMHIRKEVGELVESFVTTPEKLTALGIPEGILPQCGWLTGWKVTDDETWNLVKAGKRPMLSVHGQGKRTSHNVD
jgi:hypothetical protein